MKNNCSCDETIVFCPSFFHKGLRRRIFAWERGLKVFKLKIRSRTCPYCKRRKRT